MSEHSEEPAGLSERSLNAVERYAKLAERSQVERRSEKRVDTVKRYTNARDALTPRERAILDMTALKRRSLEDLSLQTGQSVEALKVLLRQAGDRLANHFEAGASRQDVGSGMPVE